MQTGELAGTGAASGLLMGVGGSGDSAVDVTYSTKTGEIAGTGAEGFAFASSHAPV